MKAFLMKLLKDKAMKKAGESLNENGKPSLSPLFKYAVFGGGGFTFYIIGIMVICIVVMGPAMMAREFIDEKLNDVGTFFEKTGNFITLKGWCTDSDGGCTKLAEQKYIEKLDDVYETYKNRGIDLDVDLITGTIFYGNTLSEDMVLDESEDDDEQISEGLDIHLSDVKKLASNMVSGSSIDYNRYREYLIDTYIPKRYSDFYTTDKGKERIADEIMSFANYDANKFSDYGQFVYKECASVCTTDGKCYDLEEYVTRVVTGESGFLNSFSNNYAEQWKAQAVAARTFVLNKTNNCSKPIENSQNAQVADRSSSVREDISNVVKETSGKILTYNGESISAMYDSFYKNNNYHCDDDLCYATYTKVGGEGKETHEIAAYNKWQSSFAGGHGYGMSQFGALYLADIGWKYDEILKYFYDDGVEISTLTTVRRGTILGGRYSSVAPLYNTSAEFFGNVDYNYWASTSVMPDPWNYGQCPWYARGRALQLIGESNMPDDIKQQRLTSLRNTNGNGGMWYDIPDSRVFSKSTDLYAAKPGSIVSWRNGSYGHVGIVEDVEYDSNGRAARVLLSEGWNKTKSSSTASYQMKWWDIGQFSHYYGGYTFNGYVYLLD